MGFSSTANKYFPGTEWYGESGIHVSVCTNLCLPLNYHEHKKEILALLTKQSFGHAVFRHLFKKFPDMVWLLSAEEFSNVFMVDCYNHLLGRQDSRSPGKLRNPNTGNKFHRLGLIGTMVCGIRFWCDNYSGDETCLGWRFRIQSQDEAEEETRRRTREKVTEAEELMEELVEYMFDVKELAPAKLSQAEAMLCTIEND